MEAFTIIRVSAQDQLKGYGPEVQWDDVLLNVHSLGLEVSIENRRIIQESATGWNRELFETTVREGLALFQKGEVQAMLFPRVDRETRFVVGSFGLLSEVLRNGMPVFFARDRLHLDPLDPESVERYFNKAIQAQAYVTTMRENTMRAIRMRAEKDHRMPTGGNKWAYDYHHYRNYQKPDKNSGRYTLNQQRVASLCQLKDWILSGLSLAKCEQQFQQLTGIKLSRTTLWRMLTDPIVTGKVYAYRHKRIVDSKGEKRQVPVPEDEWLLIYQDPSLRIFTDDEYYALKRQFEHNKQNAPRNTKYHYPPLKGMVICETCRLKMQALTTNFGTAYYRCKSCRNHVNAWKLWREVRDYITRLVLNPEMLTATIKANLETGRTLSNFERKLANGLQQMEMLEQAEAKVLRLHLYLPDYPVDKLQAEQYRIDQQRQQLAKEKSNLEAQIAELKQATVDQEEIKRFCEVVASNLEKMRDKQWRFLVEVLQLKIMVVGKAIFIEGAVPVSNVEAMLQSARR
jgi:hypothetical protein